MNDQINLLRQKAKEEDEKLKKMTPEERDAYIEEQRRQQKERQRLGKKIMKEKKNADELTKEAEIARKQKELDELLELKKQEEIKKCIENERVQNLMIEKTRIAQELAEKRRIETIKHEKELLERENKKLLAMNAEERESYREMVAENAREAALAQKIQQERIQQLCLEEEEHQNEMRRKLELEKERRNHHEFLENLGVTAKTDEEIELDQMMQAHNLEVELIYGNAKNVRKYGDPTIIK